MGRYGCQSETLHTKSTWSWNEKPIKYNIKDIAEIIKTSFTYRFRFSHVNTILLQFHFRNSWLYMFVILHFCWDKTTPRSYCAPTETILRSSWLYFTILLRSSSFQGAYWQRTDSGQTVTGGKRTSSAMQSTTTWEERTLVAVRV